MTDTVLEKTIFIDSSPENVWLYITDKDRLGEWFHPANTHLTQGTSYQLLKENGDKMCWGHVIEATAPTRLVYSFTHNFMNDGDTTVTWELSAVHGGTMLKLTHTGFETANGNTLNLLISHDKGWDDHFSRLREKAAD